MRAGGVIDREYPETLTSLYGFLTMIASLSNMMNGTDAIHL